MVVPGNQARQPAPATEYNTQGAAPPVISDSKIEFFRRRWLQTVLGGPRFLFAGDSKPPLSLLAAQVCAGPPLMLRAAPFLVTALTFMPADLAVAHADRRRGSSSLSRPAFALLSLCFMSGANTGHQVPCSILHCAAKDRSAAIYLRSC